MRRIPARWLIRGFVTVAFSVPSAAVMADTPFDLVSWFRVQLGGPALESKGGGACGHEGCGGQKCVELIPVEKCVTGKKEVFDCKVKYESVTVPELRYRWQRRLVTKEIPCTYCKPVCNTEETEHTYRTEKWEEVSGGKGNAAQGSGGKGCAHGTVHCRSCEPKTEKAECKYCSTSKTGETTIKVKYWTCVKEPYTVYRRVMRPVCIKQPRYEKVEVPITKYICRHCRGGGCDDCGAAKHVK